MLDLALSRPGWKTKNFWMLSEKSNVGPDNPDENPGPDEPFSARQAGFPCC